MRKLLLLILIGTAGYFAYEYLIVRNRVLEIKANKMISGSYSADIEAPALYPSYSGTVQGTVKNVSDKFVSNIILKYKLDGKVVEASIYGLDPGEQKEFSTQMVRVRSESPSFFLEKMSFK